ncbi:MAG: hypothetical protein RL344_1495, partial [Pseudomonadota bacterium]
MTTLGIVCSMTNVFATEPVCSFSVLKDVSIGNIVYETLTGDTPEAVMAQVKPFYKKYNEQLRPSFYLYNSLSLNYTFIGFNSIYSSTYSSKAYYDVKVQGEACVYSEILSPSKPPIVMLDGCNPLESVDQIECTVPTCPAPVNGQRAAADCTQTVSLTPAPGQAEPRPKGSEGGDGKSTYDLIAKVTEGNQPKAGM